MDPDFLRGLLSAHLGLEDHYELLADSNSEDGEEPEEPEDGEIINMIYPAIPNIVPEGMVTRGRANHFGLPVPEKIELPGSDRTPRPKLKKVETVTENILSSSSARGMTRLSRPFPAHATAHSKLQLNEIREELRSLREQKKLGLEACRKQVRLWESILDLLDSLPA
jgi:hypothetical protein